MARIKQSANKQTKRTYVTEESGEEEQRRLAQLEIDACRAKRRCRQEELDIEERELNMVIRREEASLNSSLQTQSYQLEVRKVALQESEMKLQEQKFVHDTEMAREKAKLDMARVESEKTRIELEMAQVEIEKYKFSQANEKNYNTKL